MFSRRSWDEQARPRDADLRSYCASRYEPVSGNHRDADTHSVEAGHQRLRVFAWQILKREESNQTDCTFRSARHGEHAVTSRRESLNVDVYVGGAADSGGDLPEVRPSARAIPCRPEQPLLQQVWLLARTERI